MQAGDQNATELGDSPVQRIRNVTSAREEIYEGTGQVVVGQLRTSHHVDASTYLLSTNTKEMIRQFCSLSEQRARDDAVRQCERHGGKSNRDTFHVMERKCRSGRSPFAKVTGTIVCTFSEVVQEIYEEMVRQCSNEEAIERICPNEIVNRLQ